MKSKHLLVGLIAILLLAFLVVTPAFAQQTDPETPTPDPTVVTLVEDVEELSSYNDTANKLIGWAIGAGTVLGLAGISIGGILRGQYDKKIKELGEKFETQLLDQEKKYQQLLLEQEKNYKQLLLDAFYKIDPRRTRVQIPKMLETEINLLEKLGFTNRDEYRDLSEIDISSKERTLVVFHIPGSEFKEGTDELKDALRLLGVLEDFVTEANDKTKIGFVVYISGRLNQASSLQNQYYNVTFANSPATIVTRLYDLGRMLAAPEVTIK